VKRAPVFDVLLSRRVQIALAVLPSALSLILYYSLAVHMRLSLGYWPEAVGDHGFPPSLTAHANLALEYFFALLYFVMFVLPLGLVLCAAIRRCKPFLFLLLVTGIAFGVSCVLMCFAPTKFIEWWLD